MPAKSSGSEPSQNADTGAQSASHQPAASPGKRARYWLDANGMAGFEGRPAQFNLGAAANAPGYNRNTPGGALMSDGDCFGFLHPDGASVMGGNC